MVHSEEMMQKKLAEPKPKSTCTTVHYTCLLYTARSQRRRLEDVNCNTSRICTHCIYQSVLNRQCTICSLVCNMCVVTTFLAKFTFLQSVRMSSPLFMIVWLEICILNLGMWDVVQWNVVFVTEVCHISSLSTGLCNGWHLLGADISAQLENACNYFS